MQNRCPVLLLTISLLTIRGAQPQPVAQAQSTTGQQTTVTPSIVCGAGATYDQITGAWGGRSRPQKIQTGAAPVELTIESTELDDRPVTAEAASAPDFCFWHVLAVGVNISVAGEVSSFANGEGAFRGGGGGKLAADTFARLQALMDRLPADHHRVPQPGRRVVVVVHRGKCARVRLYDSENLPDSVVEMIRLTQVRIRIGTPGFQPDKTWTAEEAKHLAIPAPTDCNLEVLCVSPDRSIGVAHNFETNTLTVYQVTWWPEIGRAQEKKIIRVIPEFWQPPAPRGYGVSGEFSPDGRLFLVAWGMRIGALLYDTATWQPVTDPHLFPQNLKEYLHSSDWDMGVAVTDAGDALVWNEKLHRVVSKLAGIGELEAAPVILDKNSHRIYDSPSGEIRAVAFSPDRTRVAIYAGPNNVNKLRLNVWDIQSGQKLRDFWPVEWMSFPSGQPLWWNNGRWLIAPYSSQFAPGGIGVWDANTGRFEGALSFPGCKTEESPVVQGDKLLQRCAAGDILEWSVAGIQKQLARSAV